MIRPRTRRNDGAARQLYGGARFEIDGLDAMLALPLRAVPEAAWRAIPGAGRRRRFLTSRQRGACLLTAYRSNRSTRLPHPGAGSVQDLARPRSDPKARELAFRVA